MLDTINHKNRLIKGKCHESFKSINQFKNNNLKVLLKTNTEKQQVLQDNSTVQNKRSNWKSKDSNVTNELSRRNDSPITKRLCSLVNNRSNSKTLKTSYSFTNLTNNNSNQAENFSFINAVKPGLFRKGKEEIAIDQSHNKLRGFFKSISNEKSGLPIEIETMSNQSSKTLNKMASVIKYSLENPNKNPVETPNRVSYQFKEKCINSNGNGSIKNKDTTKMTVESKAKILNESNKSDNIKYNNSSNSNHREKNLSRNSEVSATKSVDNSDSSSFDHNNTLNQVKTITSVDKISSDQDVTSKKDSLSKFGSLMNKLSKPNSKIKMANIVKSNIKTNSSTESDNTTMKLENNSAEKPIISEPIKEPIEKKNMGEKCMSEVTLNQPSSATWNLQKIIADSDTNRQKVKFSKKFFSIFSQNNYSKDSKKFKILQSSLQTIENISLDNLINLITILSVELILSSLKNKIHQTNTISTVSTKPRDKITSCSRSNNTRKSFTESTKFPMERETKQKLSLTSTTEASVAKQVNISFDLNGRALISRNASNSPNIKLNFRQNFTPGSMNSLNQAQTKFQKEFNKKNSSTLSIPSRYSSDFFSYNPNCSTPSHRRNLLSNAGLDRRSASTNLVKQTPPPANINLRGGKQPFKARTLSQNDNRNSVNDLVNLSSGISKSNHFFNKYIARSRPSSVNVTTDPVKSQVMNATPSIKSELEINDEGNYKIAIPIKTCLDFHQLDEIFSLKEELFTSCENTLLYIRSKNNMNSTKFKKNATMNNSNDSWVLFIESPTSESLTKSLKKVSAKFPQWDIKSKIESLNPNTKSTGFRG